MRITDYFILGLRNLWRRKSRSFLTIFAVVIGAISVVLMLSLVLGAKEVATQQLESIDGFTLISVSPNAELQSGRNILDSYTDGDETGQKLNDSSVEIVKSIPHVIGSTPTVGVWIKSVKLEGQDKKYRSNLMGYNPEAKVLEIKPIAGRALENNDLDKIVIGGELLKYYGYANNPQGIIGKKLILYTHDYVDWGSQPSRPPENAGKEYWDNLRSIPHEIPAEIVGVLTGGPNEGQSYITLNWARKLMTNVRWEYNDSARKLFEETRNDVENSIRPAYEKRFNEKISDSEITEDNKKNIWESLKIEMDTKIRSEIISRGYDPDNLNFQVLFKEDNINRSGYGSILVRVDSTENVEEVGKRIEEKGFGVSTAKEMLDEIEKIFYMVGLVIGAIGGIVLFVASLGIINNMIMATYERTREIGILRACGATKSNIRNMFIFEAASIGFLGGIIGLIISFGLAKVMNSIGNNIALENGVPIQDIISFHPYLVFGVIAITTLIGMLAGLLPAIRAARLDPVEALRFE